MEANYFVLVYLGGATKKMIFGQKSGRCEEKVANY